MIEAHPRALLQGVPAAELVYSSLAFHGPGQGRELPGRWLVCALESVGLAATAARQALFRLEREAHLTSRREGRSKWYRLSATGEAQIAAGRDRLNRRVSPAWDGRWTVLTAGFTRAERRARLRLLAVLAARGYGGAAGLYLHPHDDPAQLAQLIDQLRLAGAVTVFRGARTGGPTDKVFAAKAFPLRRIATAYRRFLRRFQPLQRRRHQDDLAGFALRLAAAIHYLNAAWDDPGLPAQLLPGNWPADRAQRLAHTIYESSAPAARRFAAHLAHRLGLEWSLTP